MPTEMIAASKKGHIGGFRPDIAHKKECFHVLIQKIERLFRCFKPHTAQKEESLNVLQK